MTRGAGWRLVSALLMGACAVATASTVPPSAGPAPAGGPPQGLSLGVASVAGPRYPGASDYRFLVVPYFNYEYNRWLFISPVEGAGVRARLAPGLFLSTALRYDFTSRESDDDSAFAAWKSVRGAPASAFTLEWRPGRFYVRGILLTRFAPGYADGSTLECQAAYAILSGKSGVWSAGVTSIWMDGDHANSFFSVDARQSSTSGLARRDASAGMLSAGVFTRAVVPLDEAWSAVLVLGVSRLLADAAASPVTESRVQVGAVAALAYRF